MAPLMVRAGAGTRGDPADFLHAPGAARVEPREDPGRHQAQFVGPRRGGDADPEHAVRGDRLGRGDRGDLRSHQLRPLLDDARLLQPLGEAGLLEVARQRVGQRGRRAPLRAHAGSPFRRPCRQHRRASRSGGSSSRRGAVTNTCRSGASEQPARPAAAAARGRARRRRRRAAAPARCRAPPRSVASSISLSAIAALRCWPVRPELPERPAADLEHQVVAVRPDRGDAAGPVAAAAPRASAAVPGAGLRQLRPPAVAERARPRLRPGTRTRRANCSAARRRPSAAASPHHVGARRGERRRRTRGPASAPLLPQRAVPLGQRARDSASSARRYARSASDSIRSR